MGATITQFGNLSTGRDPHPTDANYYIPFPPTCQEKAAGSSIFNLVMKNKETN